MKKALLLLASAALLLVGCSKEQVAGQQDGGMTTASFTANFDNGDATKAVADNDGKGTNVNRCIMEIYFGDALYKRMEAAMSGTPASATFSNEPVVAGKEYQILFWADCGGAEKADQYYTTTSLKAVTVAKTAFIGALVAGDNDKLDAFFFAGDYTVPQGGGSYDVTLKRPFAQLNVITTDVGEGKTVFEEDMLPEKDSVSYTAANAINVATGEVSGTETYAYEADVYGEWSTVATNHELTLSMDYILASAEQGAVDVTFITKNNGAAVMTHNLTNLPYQRNYRTNVKGELLTTGGSWTATIDAQWLSPDIVKVVEVADIKSANEIINQYAATTKQLEVKFTGEPNDSGVPEGEAAGKRAIVTTPIQEDGSLSIEVLAQTRELYVGDYPDEYTVANTVSANHAVVNINVPESSSIVTLVINAPSKSVYINGKEVANVGTITNLDAITSQNTLIIEKDQTVKNLTIRQGGLEIHGTVETLVVAENNHDNNLVKVRTSENLSQAVFDVIYKEGDHDYIDRPDFSEKQNADGTWDIVPSVCKIGETAYGSLNNAVAAIPSGGSGEIIMISSSSLESEVIIPTDKTVILELNGKTINYILDNTKWTALITNRGNLRIKDATDVDCSGSGTGMIAAEALSPDLRPTPGYASNTITNYGSLTVKSGSIVNLTEKGAACYPIDNNSNERPVTLVIDGGRLYRENSNALRVVCFGPNNLNKVTVNGGIIESGYAGMWVQLPGSDPNTKPLCSVEINGGVFKGQYPIYDYSYGNSFENTKYVINGGQFIGGPVYINYDVLENFSPADVSINGGYFYDFYTYAASNKKVIRGGYFGYSDYYFTYCVAEGYNIVSNTDPATKAEYPWTVKVKPVVKIGDVEYADIADAFAAVPTDGTPTTVTLLENIGSKVGDEIVWKEYNQVYVYTINKGQNVTFDLNGHKIYAKTTVNGETCFFRVENGGNLTIQDSLEGGELNYLDGNDNTGGFGICSAGNLTIKSGKIENHTICVNSAIQGAIDVHANEWGTPYTHHVTFKMDGGVLKSHNDNTLRIYDSSQTGTGGVVIDSEINGGEVYGADAVFIMTQWTKQYSTGETYMNNINANVKGGKFVTNNGIRVVGNVGEDNNKDYKAIKINVSGGGFSILTNTKYRENNVAFQETAGWTSTEESTKHLRSYTDVIWTAADPIYSE